MASTGEAWRLGRRPALDGLRAIGALIVLASHAGLSFVIGGGIGVDLFFALSGFLITSLLLAELAVHGRLDVVRFYGRRALRLVPALALLVAGVSVLATFQIGPSAATLRSIPTVVLYLGNWARAVGVDLGYLEHTWSLAVEEQFYLLWPVILAVTVCGARRARWSPALAVVWVSLAGALVSAFTRVLIWEPGNLMRVYNGTDTRAENLLYGCALGAILTASTSAGRERLSRVIRRLLPVAVTALLLLVAFEPQASTGVLAHVVQTAGYSLEAVASTVVVAGLILLPDSTASKVCSTRPLIHLGRISYGIYLWQWPVMLLLAHWGVSGWAALVVGAAVTIALAEASWWLVESPIQTRLRGYVTVSSGSRLLIGGGDHDVVAGVEGHRGS